MDSGATCNVISVPSLKNALGVTVLRLKKTKSVLKTYGGNVIKPVG